MKKSEFMKKYDDYLKGIDSGLQFFEKKCGCEISAIVTEKDIVKEISANITDSCDNCNKTFLYRALPYFEFRCDYCKKVRIICMAENDAKELIEKPHKDDDGNDCDGKVSYSRLQNFELKCDNCPETKILYMIEDDAKEYTKRYHKCGGNISYRKLSAEFVMPTFWDHHWDKLENFRYNKNRPIKDKKQTSYTLSAILDNILDDVLTKENLPYKDKMETIFLKRRHERCPVANIAWKGYVYDFHKKIGEYNNDDKERIHFKVEIQEKIYVPEEYAHYRDGWYRFDK